VSRGISRAGLRNLAKISTVKLWVLIIGIIVKCRLPLKFNKKSCPDMKKNSDDNYLNLDPRIF